MVLLSGRAARVGRLVPAVSSWVAENMLRVRSLLPGKAWDGGSTPLPSELVDLVASFLVGQGVML